MKQTKVVTATDNVGLEKSINSACSELAKQNVPSSSIEIGTPMQANSVSGVSAFIVIVSYNDISKKE